MFELWGGRELANADKSEQGDGGGLAVSGHPFSVVTVRKDGIYRSFRSLLTVLHRAVQQRPINQYLAISFNIRLADSLIDFFGRFKIVD